LPGSGHGIPRRIAASGPQKKRACERIRMPAWPKRRGGAQVWPVFLFVKSGPAAGGAAFTAAGKAAQLAAKGRFLRPKRQGARSKTGGVHVPGPPGKRCPGASSREFKKPFRQKWR